MTIRGKLTLSSGRNRPQRTHGRKALVTVVVNGDSHPSNVLSSTDSRPKGIGDPHRLPTWDADTPWRSSTDSRPKGIGDGMMPVGQSAYTSLSSTDSRPKDDRTGHLQGPRKGQVSPLSGVAPPLGCSPTLGNDSSLSTLPCDGLKEVAEGRLVCATRLDRATVGPSLRPLPSCSLSTTHSESCAFHSSCCGQQPQAPGELTQFHDPSSPQSLPYREFLS